MPASELPTEIVDFLLSAEGARRLEEAATLPLTGKRRLADLSLLRRTLPPEQAGAVLEQATLRRRGAAKFAQAAAMLFTAAGLQQASAEPVAAHRAARFAGRRVADLTCGIGGDSLALAATAAHLLALDRDPARLRLARHNLSVYGREGKPCAMPGCRGIVRRVVQAGRSTFYCGKCQR